MKISLSVLRCASAPTGEPVGAFYCVCGSSCGCPRWAAKLVVKIPSAKDVRKRFIDRDELARAAEWK